VTTIDKDEVIQHAANALYARNPDWATFFREICGLNGVIRRQYPTLESLSLFEETETYRLIQRMLRKLRERRPPKAPDEQAKTKRKEPPKEKREKKEKVEGAEPTRVITVRIPRCVHEALRVEAHEHRTSMNKLCISKLLQMADAEMVPAEPFVMPQAGVEAKK
jgi:hypothetical protein